MNAKRQVLVETYSSGRHLLVTCVREMVGGLPNDLYRCPDPEILLVIGQGLVVPVTEFFAGPLALTTRLSFARRLHTVHIPYVAITQIDVDHGETTYVYGSAPATKPIGVAETGLKLLSSRPTSQGLRRRPILRVIQGGKA